MKKIADFAEAALAQLEQKLKGDVEPITIELEKLSDSLNGGFSSEFIALVAPPGTGKTQLALKFALDAARTGVPVLYIGLEISSPELLSRLLALISRIPWRDIFLGKISATQFQKVASSVEQLRALNFYFEEGGAQAWSYSKLRPLAQSLRKLYPDDPMGTKPMLIIVDYLQLLGSATFREDVRERVGRAAYAAPGIVRDLNATVIALSSTARQNYAALGSQSNNLGKGDPARLLGAAKEAGEVELAADTLLVLAREQTNKELGQSLLWLAIAKSRTGRAAGFP
jgi:replicative DNA helicase